MTDMGKSKTYQEAMTSKHRDDWLEAMQEEIKSLHDNSIYELISLPKNKNALKSKWVYRLKIEEHTSRPRYKTRLVV